MPEVQHKTLRGENVIGRFGSFDFGADGIATVPIDVYNAIKGLKGFKPLGQTGGPAPASTGSAGSTGTKGKITLKKRK